MESFFEFNFDQRILKSISRLGWIKPTDVQQAVIPLIFERKCLIVQAKTGSGKTGAFVMPLIQETLLFKQVNRRQLTSAIILVPTKELCDQTFKNISAFTVNLAAEIKCVNISIAMSDEQMKSILSEFPDLIIGTPAKFISHLQNERINFEKLQRIIIDEADLIFTYGYKEDIKQLKRYLPRHPIQIVLISATVSDSTKDLRQTLIKSGEWIKVELPDESYLPSPDKLKQYIVRAEEEDKFVILLALFQLKLLRGKTVIFVNSVDRCFKLKLFLEEFGIKTALLNSELPLTCRTHVFNQFNQGLYEILIASDEERSQMVTNSSRKTSQGDEYGVVRGLDFRLVSNVLNFDFPFLPEQYIHRVGRTARADQSGTALSLISQAEELKVLEVVKLLRKDLTNDNLSMANIDDIFTPYQFKMSEIDGFRYRAVDMRKKITKNMVKEARLKEIKNELLNSQRLKTYFQDHHADLSALRHDKPLVRNLTKTLKHIPDYMVPNSLKQLAESNKINYKNRQKKARKEKSINSNRKFAINMNKRTKISKNALKKRKNFASKKKSNDPLNSFGKN